MAFPYSISMSPVVYENRTRAGLTNAVSDTYFSVLGVPPLLGRVFKRGDDDKPSSLAVLSYSYWRWLGANPNILGKTVSANNVPLTVLGVMPKSFVGTIFSDLPDVWYPLSTDVTGNHQD
jgi:putative ABC transport system permease protein